MGYIFVFVSRFCTGDYCCYSASTFAERAPTILLSKLPLHASPPNKSTHGSMVMQDESEAVMKHQGPCSFSSGLSSNVDRKDQP